MRTVKQILDDTLFLDNCSKQVTSSTLDDINVLYNHASNEVQLYDTLLAAVRNRQGWHDLSAQIKYEGDDVFLLRSLSVVGPNDDELHARFEAIYGAEGVSIPEMGKVDFSRLPNGLYRDLKVRGAWHWFNRKEQPDPWYVDGFRRDPYHIDGARNTVGDWTVLIDDDGKVTGVEIAGCTSREQTERISRFIFRTHCDTDPLRKAVEDVKALVDKLAAMPSVAEVLRSQVERDRQCQHASGRILSRSYDICDDCGWIRPRGAAWGRAKGRWFPSYDAAVREYLR